MAHRWSKGLPTQYGDLVVGTLDASLHGVAISVKNAPGQVRYMRGMRYEGVVTVVTFDDTPEVQVHREALGAPMTMRSLWKLYDLLDKTVLLLNDCMPVIFALHKGSRSPELQQAAEQVGKEAGCWVLAQHIPGVQLIAERVDGGSREGTLRLAGPACTGSTRAAIGDGAEAAVVDGRLSDSDGDLNAFG